MSFLQSPLQGNVTYESASNKDDDVSDSSSSSEPIYSLRSSTSRNDRLISFLKDNQHLPTHLHMRRKQIRTPDLWAT